MPMTKKYPCPNCGVAMEFRPDTQMLHCEFCNPKLKLLWAYGNSFGRLDVTTCTELESVALNNEVIVTGRRDETEYQWIR